MSFDKIASQIDAEIGALQSDLATQAQDIKKFRSEFGHGGTATQIKDLPLVLTLAEAADVLRLSKDWVYRNPKKYGGKKIRGKGAWKFPRDTVLRIAGYDLPKGGKYEQ